MILAAAGVVNTLVTHGLGFAIVLGVLFKWVIPAAVKFFKDRTQRIQEEIEKAEKGAVDAKAEIEELSSRLKDIGSEKDRQLGSADKEGRAGRDQIVDGAKEGARQVRDRVKREISLARDTALLELRHESIHLTLAAAEGLVEQTMDEATHKKMVADYIEGLDQALKS